MGLLSERGPGVDFADRDHTASHGAAIKGAEIPAGVTDRPPQLNRRETPPGNYQVHVRKSLYVG